MIDGVAHGRDLVRRRLDTLLRARARTLRILDDRTQRTERTVVPGIVVPDLGDTFTRSVDAASKLGGEGRKTFVERGAASGAPIEGEQGGTHRMGLTEGRGEAQRQLPISAGGAGSDACGEAEHEAGEREPHCTHARGAHDGHRNVLGPRDRPGAPGDEELRAFLRAPGHDQYTRRERGRADTDRARTVNSAARAARPSYGRSSGAGAPGPRVRAART